MLFDNNMYVAAVNEYNEKADVWKNTISFIKDRPGVFKLKSWTHVLSIGTGEFYSIYHLPLTLPLPISHLCEDYLLYQIRIYAKSTCVHA